MTSRYWAARGVKAKRALRLQGWTLKPLGPEPTGVYQNHKVFTPNGGDLGEMHSKTIAILFEQGFFQFIKWKAKLKDYNALDKEAPDAT